jgi:hypothetical protein
VRLEEEVNIESIASLRKYKRKMYRKNGDDFFKSKSNIEYPTNIWNDNRVNKLLLINQTEYLDNPEWSYGFAFNLNNDTLEI